MCVCAARLKHRLVARQLLSACTRNQRQLGSPVLPAALSAVEVL